MRNFILVLILLSAKILPAQWTQQNSGTNAQLLSVSAPSDLVVWASGEHITGWSSEVLRTTNGGLNWEIVAILDNYPGAGTLISGIDENIAVLCYDTTAYRTTNGGLNWNIVLTQRGGFFNAIEIQPNGNGYIQGDPVNGKWSIWKTTNFGTTWILLNTLNALPGEYSTFNSLFVKDSRIYFCAIGNHVYFSSNAGANWMQQTVTFSWPVPVWFYNDTVGLVGGGIAKTTNSGVNWTTLTVPGAGAVRGITGYGNNWWYIRRYYTIHFSSNYGLTWNTDSTTAGQEFWDISLSKTGTAMWIVGNNGIIYSNDGITGIHPVSSVIPQKFSLYQNFPNPFNPSTKIKFDLPGNSFVSLTVYNSAGQLIRKLINENLAKGIYETIFDGEGLSTGIYYYTFETEKFTQTKKMVLIK